MTYRSSSEPRRSNTDDEDTNAPRQELGLSRKAKLTELYCEQGEQLAAYLRKAFGNGPPDPHDIVHDAFRKLLEQKSLSHISNLRAFLWRTAINILLNQKRNIQTRSNFDYEVEHLFFAMQGPASTPERVLDVKQQLAIIEAVLKNMPERRRKAFLWNRVDGLNFTAIGNRLGITRRAVARHVIQAAYELETALLSGSE